MTPLAERAAAVRARIEAAAARSGRPKESVLLVAVSKTFPAETVAAAAEAGLETFGENRVQEAAAKIPRVARILGQGAVPSWHLVGHLQSNKSAPAVALFDMIHSVDGAGLALKLDHAASAAGKRQRILAQVNVSGEDTKSGVAPEALRALVETIAGCGSLELLGLMTIPPYDPNPEKSRRYFAALRELGARVGQWLEPVAYPGALSMGMTEDFEVAIEEGATIVRIGRALFGERPA